MYFNNFKTKFIHLYLLLYNNINFTKWDWIIKSSSNRKYKKKVRKEKREVRKNKKNKIKIIKKKKLKVETLII